jgi:hypothetical protein
MDPSPDAAPQVLTTRLLLYAYPWNRVSETPGHDMEKALHAFQGINQLTKGQRIKVTVNGNLKSVYGHAKGGCR